LAWLCEQGWIQADPGKDIRLPKEEHRLPASYLTLSEVESLLSSVDLTTAAGLRDRAILETFYSTAYGQNTEPAGSSSVSRSRIARFVRPLNRFRF
jgi:site-specific recombinase XerD